MEKQPVISVIVPVYQVEPYLDRCVESIVNQTYRNLEIILVDDGSPDNCPAMCDAWAARDSRIKVIHKQNGGLSDARNAGMAASTGTLMAFVDSDDYLNPDMYQLLAERMRRDGSDIAACGVEMIFEDGTPSRMLTNPGEGVLSAEEAMLAVVEETWLKQPVWYKLYKTAQIRDIPFPVGKCHEDVFWTYQAVGRAKRVSVMDVPCYHYLQRSGSIMGEGYSLKRLDSLEAKQQRLDYLKIHYPALENAARIDLLFSCMYHGQLAQKYLVSDQRKDAISRVREIIDSVPLPERKVRRAIPVTHHIWCVLAKFSLLLTCYFRNRMRIGIE